MFLVDTAEGRIIPDEEIKKTLASQHPYRKWVEGNSVEMSDLPRREHVSHSGPVSYTHLISWLYAVMSSVRVSSPCASFSRVVGFGQISGAYADGHGPLPGGQKISEMP